MRGRRFLGGDERWTDAKPGDFWFSIAVKDGANPENIVINDLPEEAYSTYGMLFACPRCGRVRGIAFDVPDHAKKDGAKWTWNGSYEAPTCTPSIRAIKHGKYPDCGFHGYITDGVWSFCDDTNCDPPIPLS